jgi:hypothetical protein
MRRIVRPAQAMAAKTAGSTRGPWRPSNSEALKLALPKDFYRTLGVETGVPRRVVYSSAGSPGSFLPSDRNARDCLAFLARSERHLYQTGRSSSRRNDNDWRARVLAVAASSHLRG